MTHILIFIHWFVLVFTFGNVELVTIDNSKSNDYPIEELNGYTLREVFEDGQLLLNGDISSTDNWIPFNVNGYEYYILADYLYFEATEQYGRVYNNSYITIPNHKYYVVVNAMSWSGSGQASLIGGNNVILFTNTNGIFETKTNIITAGNYPGEFMYIDLLSFGFTGQHLRMFNVYDMTSLDISSLTLEQMDYWFNVYQENSQREINETYDYIENELTTNDFVYIVLFALLWGLAIKIVKGVM